MNIQFRSFVGQYDWGWVQQQVPVLRVEDTCGIMAVDLDTNTTVGACIMDNWTDNSVQCHFMITSPLVLKHGFLDCAYSFIFNDRKCKFIYGMVPSNNDKALKLNKHMGFTEKMRMPDAYADGVDFVIMELRALRFSSSQ